MEYNPCINLSNRESAYISVARYFASKSRSKKKHGAIVVKSGRVLGTGFNKDKNHPLAISEEHIKTHASRHAEIEAIRDANWNVKGATLYVARVSSDGSPRNSRPCSRCYNKLIVSGIKKIVYTVEEKC